MTVQSRSGRVWTELTNDDTPIGSLDGFDSYAGIEATSQLEQLLGRSLELTSAFADDNKVLTVREVCARVEDTIRNSSG